MVQIKKITKKSWMIVAALVISALVAGAYFVTRGNNSEQTTQAPTNADTINLDPPTAEDAQRVDENKQKILTRQEQEKSQPTTSTGSKKTVNPVITYAGQYGQNIEVGGYINGIFEDGGSCTAVFTKNSQTVTKTVQSVKNANAVDCPVMIAQANELNTGTWTVTISYTSPNATGKSTEREIEVK
jgi:hypothetical protein